VVQPRGAAAGALRQVLAERRGRRPGRPRPAAVQAQAGPGPRRRAGGRRAEAAGVAAQSVRQGGGQGQAAGPHPRARRRIETDGRAAGIIAKPIQCDDLTGFPRCPHLQQ